MLVLLTLAHTAISLAALMLGIYVVAGYFGRALTPGWHAWFLGLAFVSSASGFLFPWPGFIPPVVIGIAALIVLALTAFAGHASCAPDAPVIRRRLYALGLVASLLPLAYITMVQVFLKVPAVGALPPLGAVSAFEIGETALLAIFAVLALAVWRRAGRAQV